MNSIIFTFIYCSYVKKITFVLLLWDKVWLCFSSVITELLKMFRCIMYHQSVWIISIFGYHWNVPHISVLAYYVWNGSSGWNAWGNDEPRKHDDAAAAARRHVQPTTAADAATAVSTGIVYTVPSAGNSICFGLFCFFKVVFFNN